MNVVAYFCFGLAIMSFIGIFTMSSSIGGSIFYIFLSAVWYQTGASFLKRKKWSWWASLVLISLFCLGSMLSIWSTIVEPLINPNVKGVGLGRWLSLIFLMVTSYLLFTLVKPLTRQVFKNA